MPYSAGKGTGEGSILSIEGEDTPLPALAKGEIHYKKVVKSMSIIAGISKTAFKPKDSETPIEGVTVHVTDTIPPDRGEGVSTDHFFLSANKVKQLPFALAVGQEIEVLYSKWGKVATLRLLEDVGLA